MAASEPEKAEELYVNLNNWLKDDVKADLPRANPFYDPKRRLIWGERLDNKLIHEGIGYGLEY